VRPPKPPVCPGCLPSCLRGYGSCVWQHRLGHLGLSPSIALGASCSSAFRASRIAIISACCFCELNSPVSACTGRGLRAYIST
jgi:hypothetical protein